MCDKLHSVGDPQQGLSSCIVGAAPSASSFSFLVEPGVGRSPGLIDSLADMMNRMLGGLTFNKDRDVWFRKIVLSILKSTT